MYMLIKFTVTACISPHCVESSNKLKVGNNMSVTHTCSISMNLFNFLKNKNRVLKIL